MTERTLRGRMTGVARALGNYSNTVVARGRSPLAGLGRQLETLLEDTHASVDHRGLVKRPAMPHQLLERSFGAESRPIGAVGKHRFHRVSDGEDLGFFEQVGAGESPRIAGAVDSLV